MPSGSGTVAEHRGGLRNLPPRHRAEPRVGCEQVHQMGGAGAREADDDDRRLELDLERLRVPAHEVLEPAGAPRRSPTQPLPDDEPTEAGEAVVRLDRRDLRGQPVEAACRRRSRPGPSRPAPRSTSWFGSRSTSIEHAKSKNACSAGSRCGSRRSSIRTSLTGRRSIDGPRPDLPRTGRHGTGGVRRRDATRCRSGSRVASRSTGTTTSKRAACVGPAHRPGRIRRAAAEHPDPVARRTPARRPPRLVHPCSSLPRARSRRRRRRPRSMSPRAKLVYDRPNPNGKAGDVPFRARCHQPCQRS